MEYREDQQVRIDTIQSRGIILKDNQVLVMFRRKDGKEYYVFPGGHMREGETPVETAIREIFEEKTIKVKGLDLAFSFKNYSKKQKIEEDYYFVGNWMSGEPQLAGEESRRMSENNYFKPMWIDITELNDINILPLMAKEWVDLYLLKYITKRFVTNN